MKKVLAPVVRALALSAKKTAILSGKTASFWGPYQPVVPEKLRK